MSSNLGKLEFLLWSLPQLPCCESALQVSFSTSEAVCSLKISLVEKLQSMWKRKKNQVC